MCHSDCFNKVPGGSQSFMVGLSSLFSRPAAASLFCFTSQFLSAAAGRCFQRKALKPAEQQAAATSWCREFSDVFTSSSTIWDFKLINFMNLEMLHCCTSSFGPSVGGHSVVRQVPSTDHCCFTFTSVDCPLVFLELVVFGWSWHPAPSLQVQPDGSDSRL